MNLRRFLVVERCVVFGHRDGPFSCELCGDPRPFPKPLTPEVAAAILGALIRDAAVELSRAWAPIRDALDEAAAVAAAAYAETLAEYHTKEGNPE